MSSLQGIESHGLAYRLKLAQHTLRLSMDKALKTLELTTPQYAALSQLEQNPGMSNAALARASFVTPQTMHGIVSNLERALLLTRKNDSKHGRIMGAKLSKKGLKVVSKAHQLISQVEELTTSSMSEKEILFFNQMLMECIKGAKQI